MAHTEFMTFDELKREMRASPLENELARQIHRAGLPTPVRQYRFDDSKRTLDFFWGPPHSLAVEVQGGIWAKDGKSGHVSGTGYTKDSAKLNDCVRLGIRVLYATSRAIENGSFLRVLRSILEVED